MNYFYFTYWLSYETDKETFQHFTMQKLVIQCYDL